MVIQGCDLVASAQAWDLDYLSRHMNDKYTVIVSQNHKFKYHDEKKMATSKANFQPTTKRVKMPFSEFVDKVRNWKKGDERYNRNTLLF